MQQLLNISGCHFLTRTEGRTLIFTNFGAIASQADSSVVRSATVLLTAQEPTDINVYAEQGIKCCLRHPVPSPMWLSTLKIPSSNITQLYFPGGKK